MTADQKDYIIQTLASLDANVRDKNGGAIPIDESPEQLAARYADLTAKAKNVLSSTQLDALRAELDREVALRSQQLEIGNQLRAAQTQTGP